MPDPSRDSSPASYYMRFVQESIKQDKLQLEDGVPRGDPATWVRKRRCCDDGTANLVNSTVSTLTPITCCTLDRFALTAKLFVEACIGAGYGGEFDGFTADHRAAYRTVRASNSAFRRVVPILPPGDGCVFFIEYDVLLSGEEASVLAYSVPRVACIIVCRVLGIHLDHYYDDLVAPAKAEGATACDDVVEFLTRCLLMDFDNERCVRARRTPYLGVLVTISRREITFALSACRPAIYRWILEDALDRNSLSRPAAKRLSGKLLWSSNCLFGRCGRVYLIPIRRRGDAVQAWANLNGNLRTALQWWRELFASSVCALRRTVKIGRSLSAGFPVIFYSDACEFGLGGVALVGRRAYYFSLPVDPPSSDIAFLECEACCILQRLCEYDDGLAFVDNNIALSALVSGRASCDAIVGMVADFWLAQAAAGRFLWLERVDSGSNIADLPSRLESPARLLPNFDVYRLEGVSRLAQLDPQRVRCVLERERL